MPRDAEIDRIALTMGVEHNEGGRTRGFGTMLSLAALARDQAFERLGKRLRNPTHVYYT